MESVELKTCYWWSCDGCGKQNFAVPVKAEFVNVGEKEEAFRAFHELDAWADLPDSWEDFEMVQMPETVICDICRSEFSTECEGLD